MNGDMSSMLRQQFLSYGMTMKTMSGLHGNSTLSENSGMDSSMMTLIFGMIAMQFMEFVCKFTPVVVESGKNLALAYMRDYRKTIEDSVINKVTKQCAGVIKFIYVPDYPTDKSMALIHHMCNQDESLKLVFSNDFIVDNREEFTMGYRDVICKITQCDVDDAGKISKVVFVITSNIMPLRELKRWITDVEKDFFNFKNNKLGSTKFYFDDITNNSDMTRTSKGYQKDTRRHMLFSMTEFVTNKSLRTVFGPEIKPVKRLIDIFVGNPEWYKDKGIPHCLGILLHGKPGTGKTTTIKAIAKDTKRHIINVALKPTTTQTQMRKLFFDERINVITPSGNEQTFVIPINQRLYVFEEVDCISDVILDRSIKATLDKPDDENHKKPDENTDANTITLGFLLNLFDGVLETPGRMMIMTSNFPDRIDSALIRPGRIDLMVEFKECTDETLNEMFAHFFSEHDIGNFEFDKTHSGIITPAKVSCIMCENYTDPQKAYDEIIREIREIEDTNR